MANTSPTPYKCVVFHKDKTQHPLVFEFMKSIYYLHKYLEKHKYDYHYINIYNRKTGQYLGRQYFDKFVIDKPAY